MTGNDAFRLDTLCDAVVMLTMNDWLAEPVGTHYHFATRFAKQVPVYYVQPDMFGGDGWNIQDIGIPNLKLVHVNSACDERQVDVLQDVLAHLGVERPILWANNPHMWRAVEALPSVLRVYHSTEEYLKAEGVDDLVADLKRLLPMVELVPSTSRAQVEHLVALGLGDFVPLPLPNGCDFGFWGLGEDELGTLLAQPPVKRVVYQGNINRRLDFELLEKLACLLDDFEFAFFGRTDAPRDFKQLRKACPNVKWLGELPLDALRGRCRDGAVAIIPFKATDEFLSTTPLKSFEYLALGLPVVCSNFAELRQYGDMFAICNTAEEWAEAIRTRWQSRWDEAAVRARVACAKATDYDARFAELMDYLAGLAPARAVAALVPPATAAAGPVPHLDAATYHRLYHQEMKYRRRTERIGHLLPEGTRRWRLARGIFRGVTGHGWGRKAPEGTMAPND